MTSSPSEHEIQASFIAQARILALSDSRLRWLFAIPNGGKRGWKTAIKLRDEGVLRGVWDLCLPVPSFCWHGLWLECKSAKGKLSPEQWEFKFDQEARGYRCVVFNKAEHGIIYLCEYLGIPIEGGSDA